MAESTKNDYKDDKLRWDLLPLDLIEEVVKVYHFGAKKYAPNRWKNLPDAENRYYSALMRHLSAYRKGETKDEESGLHPLAHVIWNGLALLYFALKKKQ